MSQHSTAQRPSLALLAVPVIIVLAIVMGTVYGRGALFITLAGGALLGAITMLWESLQGLTGDAPLTLEEAIGLGAPSAEEERKQAVLRVLKDLEYERAVGKISETDYQELSRRYRKEAKDLLRLLDDSLAPARERAEKLLKERLKDLPQDEQSSRDTQPPESSPPQKRTDKTEAESDDSSRSSDEAVRDSGPRLKSAPAAEKAKEAKEPSKDSEPPSKEGDSANKEEA